jgi:hypothetical protein
MLLVITVEWKYECLPVWKCLVFSCYTGSLTLVRKLKFSNFKFVDAKALETDVITYRHNARIKSDNLSSVNTFSVTVIGYRFGHLFFLFEHNLYSEFKTCLFCVLELVVKNVSKAAVHLYCRG